MVIISKTALTDFGKKHPDSINALNKWYEDAKAADWNNFAEMKNTFNSVDGVGNDRYVFDIRGNNYRLIAMVFFSTRTIFIRFIGTHKEYDRTDCSIV